MTRKNSNLEILSFSVPAGTAIEIEKLSRDIGYSNRSELIRDAIRGLLRDKSELDALKGQVEGVIIALYDHSAEGRVFGVKHDNMDIIRSYMHSDFSGQASKCCDILVFSGTASRVRRIAHGLRAIKNVEEVKVFIS